MLNEIIRNNVRKIVVTIIVIFIAVIAYSIYLGIVHNGKIAVTVSIVPSDAHTTLNGQSVSSGTIYLKAGEYTVKGSKQGFEDYSQKKFIDEDKKTILVTLTGQSDEAKKWAQDNQQKYLENESLGGSAAEQEGTAFHDKNPITDALPYDGLLYTIGYKNDSRDPSGNSIILTIDATQGNRNAAIEQIRTFGYDPTDFIINFNDYTDPFSS